MDHVFSEISSDSFFQSESCECSVNFSNCETFGQAFGYPCRKLLNILNKNSMNATGNSELIVPRVIKPRKRRKKEKKIPSENQSEGTLPNIYGPLCIDNNANFNRVLNILSKSLEKQIIYSENLAGYFDVPAEQLSSIVASLKMAEIDSETTRVSSSPETSVEGDNSIVNNAIDITSINEKSNGETTIQLVHPTSSNGNSRVHLNLESNAKVPGAKNIDLLLDDSRFMKSEFGASHPPQRPWIVTNYRHSKVACMFTILCYNVLCDKYATRQMYRYCPTWALDWDYRKKTILDEIQHYSADIIALQEVETDQFYHFFLPELKKHGYDGIFSPKSRAKTMSEKERVHVDGCAIFFRINKFSLLKMHLVEFNQLAMANADGSDDMLNRVMTKDNIGLAALLETKKGAWETEPTDTSICHQPLLVCTCHIHWDPEYCDVKLIQTMMLMNELKHIADDISNEIPGQKASNVNLLLCGDFNSLPDSGTVQFLTSGFIPVNHPDFKELGYKSCLKKLCVLDKQNQFSHPFHLVSAYGNGVMPYTNYTFDFKGVIDYMFFTKTGLRNLGLLGPVDPEWLKKNKIVGCPHPHIPSDHFPLLVEMELIPPKSPSNGLVLRR